MGAANPKPVSGVQSAYFELRAVLIVGVPL